MKKKSYLYWGMTIVLSACGILLFYDTLFNDGGLLSIWRTLTRVLEPVIYGAAMAYLLAPVVNICDRMVDPDERIKNRAIVRGMSIALTWLMVLVALYGLFSVLLPELAMSVRMLFLNIENYYQTILGWVDHFMENYPELTPRVMDMLQGYYKDLLDTLNNEILPGMDTIVAITGGVWSVVSFFGDLLVGMCVSVYILARKETFAAHSRRTLYSFMTEERYALALRCIGEGNRIFSGFVRGKLVDSLIIGFLCFTGCFFMEMPYTPLVSVVVGVTNVIPFFGPFLGAIPSAILILLADPMKCLYFIIFILALQQFDGNILGPKILGKATGVTGFWVILAILVGGGFFGPLGMFLGVPVCACIKAAIGAVSEKKLRARGMADVDAFDAESTRKFLETMKNHQGGSQ
ncbi:MAG: AI-2E family transporter [Oscillospiraceae bacterium]|nr:AI-2E family transporter [Oscillospiraceae bacterium]